VVGFSLSSTFRILTSLAEEGALVVLLLFVETGVPLVGVDSISFEAFGTGIVPVFTKAIFSGLYSRGIPEVDVEVVSRIPEATRKFLKLSL